jgi:hypothetical protein
LFVGKLALVVVIHSLGGSHTNWYHMPNPQQGVAQPSTRVPFGSSPGKGQEPLTITTIEARDKHLPLLDDPCCSKPSRWWQPPRVTSKSRSKTQSPSASRCNHSNNALGFSHNLTKVVISMQMAKGVSLSWPRGLNRGSHEIESLAPSLPICAR